MEPKYGKRNQSVQCSNYYELVGKFKSLLEKTEHIWNSSLWTHFNSTIMEMIKTAGSFECDCNMDLDDFKAFLIGCTENKDDEKRETHCAHNLPGKMEYIEIEQRTVNADKVSGMESSRKLILNPVKRKKKISQALKLLRIDQRDAKEVYHPENYLLPRKPLKTEYSC